MKQPLVSVTIITYKQEEYIAQCIESVLAQKVNFDYEIIIGDDMSPDNTRSICQSYADKYEFIHLCPRSKNLGVAGNWADCTRQAKGKYIMMLDGDDYWQNSNKMQMQVDLMEAHPECVLCHTDVDILRMKTGAIEKDVHKQQGIVPPEGMILNEVMAGREHMVSSSICMRGEVVRTRVPFDVYIKEKFAREDWPTIVILSAYGEVRYISISTATYRVGQPSITNEINYDKIRENNERDFALTSFLYSMFPEWGPMDYGTIDYYKTHVYHNLLIAAYKNNDYKSARKFASQDPTDTKAKYCAKNWLTFQLFRLIRILRKQ